MAMSRQTPSVMMVPSGLPEKSLVERSDEHALVEMVKRTSVEPERHMVGMVFATTEGISAVVGWEMSD